MAPEAELRDYFDDAGVAKVTRLADYVGDADSQSLAYRIGNRVVTANNNLLGGITGVPGQFRENWKLLRDPEQRRMLGRALVDDSLLNHERRKALFSILLWSTLFIWIAVGVVIGIVNRDALTEYQSVVGLFFYSLATSIFLPTPFEILLENAVDSLGVLWTVLVASIAKTAGSWIVLMMGDKANEGLEHMLERYKTLDRMFKALERFAQKYGYFAVFILFAIPFMSDTAPLFILAVLNMRKSIFLAVTFAAIVVRSLLFIYAGDAFSALF